LFRDFDYDDGRNLRQLIIHTGEIQSAVRLCTLRPLKLGWLLSEVSTVIHSTQFVKV